MSNSARNHYIQSGSCPNCGCPIFTGFDIVKVVSQGKKPTERYETIYYPERLELGKDVIATCPCVEVIQQRATEGILRDSTGKDR